MTPISTSISTSITTALIPSSPTIIYFDGPLKGNDIIDSQCGYGLEFRSESQVNISIKHNCIFNQFVEKIWEIIHCGNHKIMTHIDYHHLIKIRNNHLLNDTFEIKCDNGIAKMVNWWKKTQIIDRSVLHSHTLKHI